MAEKAQENKASTERIRRTEAGAMEEQLALWEQPQVIASQALQKQAPLTPRQMLALQRTIGNQGVQRMVVPRPKTSAAASSGPKLTIRHRTVSRKTIQRNLLHKIAKPLSKYLTLGSDKERRTVQPLDEVKQETSGNFGDIQDVSIPSGQYTLTGRYYLGKPSNTSVPNDKYRGYTILFLSGSHGSAETYSLPLAKTYCDQGADVLAVNYRGFGDSTRKKGKKDVKVGRDKITDQGLYDDARAMFDWLGTKNIAPDKIIVHGYSLGGAMASNLVADLAQEGVRVGGLILHSPIDSVKETAKRTNFLGEFGAKAGGLELDTVANLQRLAQIPGFRDLAIHFMTGRGADEQLSMDTTRLDVKAGEMGFTNFRSTQAKDAKHTDTTAHMIAAVEGGSTYKSAANSVNRLFPQQPPPQQATQTPPDSSTVPQPADQQDAQQPSLAQIESQLPQEEATDEEMAETLQAAQGQPNKVRDLIAMFNQMSQQK